MRQRSSVAVAVIAGSVALTAPACFLLQRGEGSQLARGVAPEGLLRGTQPGVSAGSTGAGAPLGTIAWGAVAGVVAAAASLAARRPGVARRSKDDDEESDGKWVKAKKVSELTESVGAGVLDNTEIAKILPHRYPFLLVDKVIALEKFKRAVGVKNVSANEPQFTGHFPDRPIMPGVLMVEALAQLAGCVCMNPGDQVFFAGINGVKFRKPVVPGDTLVMEVEVLKFREKSGIAKLSGKAYVDGKLAIEVKEFTCALVK